MKKSRAFTLVEIIVVIAVCSSLFSLSFYSLRRFLSQSQLATSADKLVSELRKIQSQARLERQTTSLDISKQNLPSGIKIIKTSQIKFAPSGFTDFGGSGSIILRNRLGKTKKIVVSTVGRVRVE